MIFYFKMIKNIQFLTRKFQKNKFYASFQFYFMYVLLVTGDIVSKHEQLLILTYIDTSILLPCPWHKKKENSNPSRDLNEKNVCSSWGRAYSYRSKVGSLGISPCSRG
jgi:hypothetical protein